jgi:hypothetical protein
LPVANDRRGRQRSSRSCLRHPRWSTKCFAFMNYLVTLPRSLHDGARREVVKRSRDVELSRTRVFKRDARHRLPPRARPNHRCDEPDRSPDRRHRHDDRRDRPPTFTSSTSTSARSHPQSATSVLRLVGLIRQLRHIVTADHEIAALVDEVAHSTKPIAVVHLSTVSAIGENATTTSRIRI